MPQAGIMNGLVRLRIDHRHHRLDHRTRREVLPGAGFHVLGVPGQQAFVDVALHVDRQGEPGLAVDQADQAFELGRVLDFVLRLQEDRADDAALLRQLVEQLDVGRIQRLAGQVLDVGPARAIGQHRRFADLGDALLVHLEEQQIGNLADIGLVGHALIAQHMREIPDLGDESLGVHAGSGLSISSVISN